MCDFWQIHLTSGFAKFDDHLELLSNEFRKNILFSQLLNISLNYSQHHSPIMLPGPHTEISGPWLLCLEALEVILIWYWKSKSKGRYYKILTLKKNKIAGPQAGHLSPPVIEKCLEVGINGLFSYLPEKFAKNIMTMFGSIYVCEQLFSFMKLTKLRIYTTPLANIIHDFEVSYHQCADVQVSSLSSPACSMFDQLGNLRKCTDAINDWYLVKFL